jgi:hypothetical protein
MVLAAAGIEQDDPPDEIEGAPPDSSFETMHTQYSDPGSGTAMTNFPLDGRPQYRADGRPG